MRCRASWIIWRLIERSWQALKTGFEYAGFLYDKFLEQPRGSSGRFSPRKASAQVAGYVHRDESVINKIIKLAARDARIDKAVCGFMLRHCFAMPLLQIGADARTVQRQLGHSDVKTTEIYIHI